MTERLEARIEHFFRFSADDLTGEIRSEALAVFDDFKAGLNQGEIRAASPGSDGEWQVHQWVKRGILLGFRLGGLIDYSIDHNFRFFDKETYWYQLV